MASSCTLLIIAIIIILVFFLWYFNSNNNIKLNKKQKWNARRKIQDNYDQLNYNDYSNNMLLVPNNDNSDIVDELISEYDYNSLQAQTVCSPENKNFTHKKQKFYTKTQEEIKDLFDVDKMLPQQIEDDWFDIGPLQDTKKIKGSNLINPKHHMGINTIATSSKNMSRDIRGDIVTPKVNISPWMNSSIEPDPTLRGLKLPERFI